MNLPCGYAVVLREPQPEKSSAEIKSKTRKGWEQVHHYHTHPNMADTRVHQPQTRRGCSSLRGAKDAGGCGGRNLRRLPRGQRPRSAATMQRPGSPATGPSHLPPAPRTQPSSTGPAAPLPRTVPPAHGGDRGPRAAPGVTGDIPAPPSAETAGLAPLPASAETSTQRGA